MSVLDRFVKVSKENSDAYGAMVASVDAISTRVVELTDTISGLTDTLEDENMATTLKTCTDSIKEDVGKLQSMMGSLTEPKYNLLKGVSEYMAYKRSSDTDIQEASKSLMWFLSIGTFFRQNQGKLLFVVGILLVLILGGSGLSVWDALKFIVR
jgi:hypothetical protein